MKKEVGSVDFAILKWIKQFFNELFKEPEFPVDTHVMRIAKRLGLAKDKDDVIDIERKLRKAFDRDRWIKLHHQFIHFGRSQCKAKNPQCDNCRLIDICKEKH